MKYIMAILLIIAVKNAHADTIKVNMLGVKSTPSSMPITLQKKLHRIGVKRIAAKGINISVGWFKSINDPFPNYREGVDLGVIFNEFSGSYFYSIKYIKKGEVLHYLAPPYVVNGVKYIGGVGLKCSAPRGGYSYSNASEINAKGAARTLHSLHAFMHELLHTLGAEHIESPISIMHPDALSELDKQIIRGGLRRLNILDETRLQIYKCIGK